MPNRVQAKAALDAVIKKSRVHLYKPIQIAEILYRDRVFQDIDLLELEDYRTKSKRWRDDVCQVLLGRVCTSSAKFQDDLFNETAIPPVLINELGKENRRTNGGVEAYIVQDDEEHFNQAEFLKKVAECPNCPKSSCPSPEIYRDAYDCDADHVYAVTLSEKLSGSYNSAVLGKNLYLEDHPDAKVYVFNSCSASVGETLIGLKIQELEEKGLSFEEVVEQTEAYILSQDTWFVLENLDTLRKNGRLGTVKALVATALKIKPVMGSTDEGTIIQLDQARGMKKALVKMVNSIEEKKSSDPQERMVGIAHCNCPQRAEMVKEEIIKRLPFKDVILVNTAGVSTMYANDGGIIVVA